MKNKPIIFYNVEAEVDGMLTRFQSFGTDPDDAMQDMVQKGVKVKKMRAYQVWNPITGETINLTPCE